MPCSRGRAAVLALVLSGFALTLAIFYPGIMTIDATYVYRAIAEGAGDWQSPVMTWLWSKIDLIAPPSASLFLLAAATYWLAFGLIALNVARRSFWLALLLPVLALTPPALSIVGVIWRDILLAGAWLLACGLCLWAAQLARAPRITLQCLALVLIAFGVLLRPNAIPAGAILSIYAIWPREFWFWRSAFAFLPIAALLYLLVPATYYGLLDAKRQNPLHSIFVFDLGGITHFTGENQFPVEWPPEQNTLLTHDCYKPTQWDIYWTTDPCQFVMARLESEKIFGTPRLVSAWREAVTHHPLAYLQHRAAFMGNFLAGRNLTMWVTEPDGSGRAIFTDRTIFTTFKHLHDLLYATPLFRVWPWLLGCVVLIVLAWRKRTTPAGVFVLASSGSAILYVATYFFVGVASDFRYAYWAVLAALTGLAVLPHGRAVPAAGCAAAPAGR